MAEYTPDAGAFVQGHVVIVELIPGTPADMSGQLLSGDVIEQADGQTLMGMYMADVVALISVCLALSTASLPAFYLHTSHPCTTHWLLRASLVALRIGCSSVCLVVFPLCICVLVGALCYVLFRAGPRRLAPSCVSVFCATRRPVSTCASCAKKKWKSCPSPSLPCARR